MGKVQFGVMATISPATMIEVQCIKYKKKAVERGGSKCALFVYSVAGSRRIDATSANGTLFVEVEQC
jgi:hypothetical protein